MSMDSRMVAMVSSATPEGPPAPPAPLCACAVSSSGTSSCRLYKVVTYVKAIGEIIAIFACTCIKQGNTIISLFKSEMVRKNLFFSSPGHR